MTIFLQSLPILFVAAVLILVHVPAESVYCTRCRRPLSDPEATTCPKGAGCRR